VYWNPAGIATIDGISFTASYTSWVAGLNHNFVALALPVGEQYAAAISFVSLSSGDIEITTVDNPEGTGSFYSISNIAIGLTFGGKLTEQFGFGASLKYIDESLSSLSSSGLMFDVGTIYETGIQGLRLGMSISNLGSELRFDGQDLSTRVSPTDGAARQRDLNAAILTNDYPVPLAFRVGVAADLIGTDEEIVTLEQRKRVKGEHRLTASAEFETLSDTPEQYVMGLEYVWSNFLSLRGGYRFGHDELGLAAGGGVQFESAGFVGSVDYSWNMMDNLTHIHRIGVSLRAE
jgi:hypothetical protein